MNLKLDQIKTGHEVWCDANTRVNARLQAARELLERSQQAEIIDVEVNVADINKLFEERSHGKHMLELEFEPMTPGSVTEPSNRTRNPTTVWIWKHKLTGAEVRRYQTSSKKGWDTGVLSRYLRSIKESKNKVAYERAQRILTLNSKNSQLDMKAAPEKQILKREDLLKQWVSVLLFCFSSTNNSTHAFSFCLSCSFYRFVRLCSVLRQTVPLFASREHMRFVFSNSWSHCTCRRTGLHS